MAALLSPVGSTLAHHSQHALLNQKCVDLLSPVGAAQPSPACPAAWSPCFLSLWLILSLYQIVPSPHFLPSTSLGHIYQASHCLPAMCSVPVSLSTPVSTCMYTDRYVYYNKSAYVLYLLSTLLLYTPIGSSRTQFLLSLLLFVFEPHSLFVHAPNVLSTA